MSEAWKVSVPSPVTDHWEWSNELCASCTTKGDLDDFIFPSYNLRPDVRRHRRIINMARNCMTWRSLGSSSRAIFSVHGDIRRSNHHAWKWLNRPFITYYAFRIWALWILDHGMSFLIMVTVTTGSSACAPNVHFLRSSSPESQGRTRQTVRKMDRQTEKRSAMRNKASSYS